MLRLVTMLICWLTPRPLRWLHHVTLTLCKWWVDDDWTVGRYLKTCIMALPAKDRLSITIRGENCSEMNWECVWFIDSVMAAFRVSLRVRWQWRNFFLYLPTWLNLWIHFRGFTAVIPLKQLSARIFNKSLLRWDLSGPLVSRVIFSTGEVNRTVNFWLSKWNCTKLDVWFYECHFLVPIAVGKLGHVRAIKS